MKGYKIFLMMAVICIAYMWTDAAYPHGKEKHQDKRTVTEAENKNIEEKAVESPPVLHEEHRHAKTVKTGSFNLIQIGKKQGHNTAVIFTGFIAAIWGIISFYWRDSDG